MAGARRWPTPTRSAVQLDVAQGGQHHEVVVELLQILSAVVPLLHVLLFDCCQDEPLVLVEHPLHRVRRKGGAAHYDRFWSVFPLKRKLATNLSRLFAHLSM